MSDDGEPQDHAADTDPSADQPASDGAAEAPAEGVGWLPAILAFSLLLTACMFVCCGVTTYMLYQKRTELAARTLSGHTIPSVDQSQLDPADKQQINAMLGEVVADAEAGRLENWQASGVMNRLTRIPLLEWGDLAAIEAMIQADDAFDAEEKAEAEKHLSRLRQSIAMDKSTIFDVGEVLAPVLLKDESLRGRRLKNDPSQEELLEVIYRARLIGERDGLEDRKFPDQSITAIVRDAIQRGRTEGSR